MEEFLIEILKKDTELLKTTYLEKTKEWATAELARNIKRRNYYAEHGQELEVENKNKYYAEQKFYWNSPRWYFTQEFVKKMINDAETHYCKAIEKLAQRIIKKGLNVNNIKLKTSKIGVNIETIFSDGAKSVRAWTIIAGGAVQKPHYRYLIK